MLHLKRFALVLTLVSVLVMPLVIHAQENDLPEQITLAMPGLHPEGIEYDATNERFLVGSITMGGVYEVLDDGTATPFVAPVEGLASIGIHIDKANERLLVAMSDFAAAGDTTLTGRAVLGAYDLKSGEELYLADLTDLYPDARYFANDVTSDPDGNAYLTNSFAPVIYRVDAEGNGEVFLESEDFVVEGFGLNGIDYHPDGYLLVAVGGKAEIYKVPLDDPASYSQVELPEPVGVDGMLFDANGRLICVATTFDADGNAMSEVLALSSDDDWATAVIAARGTGDPAKNPTTATVRDGAVYVVHADFNSLFSGQAVEEFAILRVDLEE